MLFPMNDTDLHAILSGRNCLISTWNNGCALWENQKECVSAAKDLGCQKRQQLSSAREVSCWNRLPDDSTRGESYSRTRGRNDCVCTGTSRQNASKGSARLQRQRRCLGMNATTLRFGKSTGSGRQFLQHKLNLWMRPGATISSGCSRGQHPSLDAPQSCVQSLELQEQKRTGFFCHEHMYTIGARTKKRQKDPSRALFEFSAQKPGQTMKKDHPQDNFL